MKEEDTQQKSVECRFIWKIFSRKAFVYYRETVPVWPQFNWQFLLKMNNLSTYTNNLSLSKIKTSKTSKTIKTLQSQRVNLIITNNYPISSTNNPIDYSLCIKKILILEMELVEVDMDVDISNWPGNSLRRFRLLQFSINYILINICIGFITCSSINRKISMCV